MSHVTKDSTSSIRAYALGFVLSLALTVAAYLIVVNKISEGVTLLGLLALLGLTQAVVQLFFFLHLDQGKGSRLKIAAFLSMLIVLVIVVGGSLWIMHHLDYNMMNMPSEQLQERMNKEAGF